MHLDSTQGEIQGVSLKKALLEGFAPGGGLYLPQKLPFFSIDQLKKLRGLSFLELSIELGKTLFQEELSKQEVETICEEAFTFPTPFLSFPDGLHLLELFHGPSLSFKDFGARFLASLMKHWFKGERITVLVATTGDTGSAVGQAFRDIPGVRVYILYPKGLVTPTQEKQLTTIGRHVTALEIEGSFETCQELLERATQDPDLQKESHITTGNSINIGRLLPQALYYFYAYLQLKECGAPAVFSIPCGNFGHLVSGIFAKRMGLPISRFLAVTNINDEVPLFFRSGVFRPHPAYHTIAVSMDVGNPSNFPRLLHLYDHSLEKIRSEILGISFTDEQIEEVIKQMYGNNGYLLDPHTATAYLALQEYLLVEKRKEPGIFFATAHPAKFLEAISSFMTVQLPLPSALQYSLSQPKRYISLPPTYESLKQTLQIKTFA